MSVAAIVFWAAVSLLFWGYVGYFVFVRVWARRLWPASRAVPGPVDDVILLISAYNEEGVIEAKLANAVALKSPAPLRIVVVSDGSTDRTDALVREYAQRDARVQLIRVEGRQGKNAGLNAAIAQLAPDAAAVIVFSDANALYDTNALTELCAAIAQGSACAVGKLSFVDQNSGTARSEGLYWRYETALKAAEAEMGRMPFANGAIFAVRARDIGVLPSEVPNDFWTPVLLLARRRPVTFAPGAVAFEPAPSRGGEEFRRKTRMANRQMRGIIACWPQLDGLTRFQLVSHKVLRWLGGPLFVTALVAAVVAAFGSVFYALAATLLSVPLVLAAAGATVGRAGLHFRAGELALHLIVVQTAAMIGCIEAVAGKRRPRWEVAETARREVRLPHADA